MFIIILSDISLSCLICPGAIKNKEKKKEGVQNEYNCKRFCEIAVYQYSPVHTV